MPDRGLDSQQDLKIFTRILLFGLVAIVLVSFVLLLLTGNWLLLGVLVGAYALVAAAQWYAAYRRHQAHGAVGEF